MTMRIVVVGANAAGAKAASKAKRINPKADVTMIDRGNFISYGVRIPDESGHHSGGKAATVPTGIRPAFRSDCGHYSGAIRPV